MASPTAPRRNHHHTAAREPAPVVEPRPAMADPRVQSLLLLQRSAGNAAVARLLAPQQATVQRTPLDDAATAVGDAVSGATGAVGQIVSGIGDAASAAWDALTDDVKAAWAGIASAGAFVGKWGMEVLDAAGEWFWDLIAEAPERIWRLLEHVGSGIVGTLDWAWRGLQAAAGHWWSGMVAQWTWLGKGASGLFDWLWAGLAGGATWAERALAGDRQALREGISGLFGWLGQGVQGLVAWADEGLQLACAWMSEGLAGTARWLLEGLLAGLPWAVRLVTKCLDLIGAGEIFDLLSQIVKTGTRELLPGEVSKAHMVFKDTIDYGQVRVDENSLLARLGAWWRGYDLSAIVTFHTINFNRKIDAAASQEDAGLLVHEMTHVWQYEHVGSQYLPEAFHAGEMGAGYNYGPSDNWRSEANGRELADRWAAGARMASFNREQQGDIAKHYYLRLTEKRTPPYDVGPWEPYIDNLRSGEG